ncbi:Uncharacterised protein [Vibrio cholerae]|nr:Uncharacterised protein [Vibrio cholerae]
MTAITNVLYFVLSSRLCHLLGHLMVTVGSERS